MKIKENNRSSRSSELRQSSTLSCVFRQVLPVLIFFVLNFKSFSQEKYEIPLVQNEEFNMDIKIGDVDIPMSLNWDKEDNSILIQFKGVNVSEKFLYFFPKTEVLDKAKKKDKQIWFGNDIRKEGKVNKCVDNLVNAAWKNASDEIKESTLGGPAPIKKCEFLFKVQDLANGCSITLRAYLATTEKEKGASKRGRKIDYTSNIVMDISLLEVCQSLTLKNIIDTLAKKELDVRENITNIGAEADSLAKMACKDACKDKKIRPLVAEANKLNTITDERYAHYNDCDNLKAAIADYNTALMSCDTAIREYNKKLQDKQKKCKCVEAVPGVPAGDCELLKTANRELMNLFYEIEQAGKSNPNFRTEFDRIKKTVVGCEKCKNNKDYKEIYKAYENWCSGIEKLLKK